MIKPLLHKQASLKLALILLGLGVVFNVFIMPMLAGDKGLVPIDLQFAYTPERAYELIDSYSDETRATYALGEMTFDVAYPIVYTLFMSVTLMLLYPDKWKLAWLPYAIFTVDMFENTGIITMLYNYPVQLRTVAWMTSVFSTTKWTLVVIMVLFIFYGLITKLRTKKEQPPLR
jgi:hypothetical protein